MENEDEFREIMGEKFDDREMQYMWEEFCDSIEADRLGIQSNGEEMVQIPVQL